MTNSERKSTIVDTKTNLIMQKDYATIATIDMVEWKNLGVVVTKNYMQVGCAKTVTLTTTTENGEKRLMFLIKRKTLIFQLRVMGRLSIIQRFCKKFQPLFNDFHLPIICEPAFYQKISILFSF